MGFKKYVLIVFIVISSALNAVAQRDSIGLNTIAAKMEKLSAEHPFEKVYLHFDKPYYAVGDTIWFKVYVTAGPTHQLSGTSHIVYVDLISSQDSIVKSLKLSSQNGIAFGDITLLQKDFKQGNYHVRAYTNWMRNFGPDYFFNKTISVGDAYNNSVNPKISATKIQKGKDELINARILYQEKSGSPDVEKKVSWTIQNEEETIGKGKAATDRSGFLSINFPAALLSSSETASLVTVMEVNGKTSLTNKFPLKTLFQTNDVQFFPEGGELISGVRSKVAFKAIDPNGVGINVKGTVVDNAGNEIASFESQHAGMGIFPLSPEADKTYKAIVTFPDGSKNTYDLPNIRADGINLAVNNNDPDNLVIKIATNQQFFKQYQNRGFYIVAQSGGAIYYTGLAALQSLVYTGSVPKSKFPTGILQVTLFAANGEPLSERIVFIQHNDALDLSVTPDLQSYSTRQHVKMAVMAKSKTLPVVGSFSVAVIDETKVPVDEDAETTILSSFLLTSDLRGYIEKPGYYFKKAESKALADLDILMLTQGYRRFSYMDILADKYPPGKFLPEKAIEVTGTLRTDKGLPVFNGYVSLRLPTMNTAINAKTDAEGHFIFPNVPIFDSTKVVLDAHNNNNANTMAITADIPLRQAVAKNLDDPNRITNIDSTLSIYLQNSKKKLESSHILKEVVIKSTGISKVVTHEPYPTLIGLTPDATQIISGDRLKDCGEDIRDCLTAKVLGIWPVDGMYYIKDSYTAQNGDKRPIKFFLNGLPIDETRLIDIKPEEVQSIESFFKDGVARLFDFYQCNGIVSISTKSNGISGGAGSGSKELPADIFSQGSEVTIHPKGFYRARVFYSPKYDDVKGSALQTIDLRSTIYWNPEVVTDKTGIAAFDYYNAGSPGNYRAVIEGIDLEGNIGRFVLHYNVK